MTKSVANMLEIYDCLPHIAHVDIANMAHYVTV